MGGWNAPLCFQPRLEDVFLSTRRTVSSERASTICNSTHLSANHCTVQRVRSWGGGVHAKAIRYASARPSSVRSRPSLPQEGGSWGLRLRTAVSPSVPKINYHPRSGWFEDAPLKGAETRDGPLGATLANLPSVVSGLTSP